MLYALVILLTITIGGETVQRPYALYDEPYTKFDTADDCQKAAMFVVGSHDGPAEAKCYELDTDGKLGRVVSETSRSG